MNTLLEVGIYLAIVGLLLGGGVWLGMLIAPRFVRMMDSNDEGPGDDD